VVAGLVPELGAESELQLADLLAVPSEEELVLELAEELVLELAMLELAMPELAMLELAMLELVLELVLELAAVLVLDLLHQGSELCHRLQCRLTSPCLLLPRSGFVPPSRKTCPS
jgi:hypothetical protein